MTRLTRCRHCKADLSLIFADLGATPVSNDFLRLGQRFGAEPYYPLRAFVCQTCRLVQLEDFRRSSDLFREDYAYFSSISSTWLEHARRYAEAMSQRYGLQPSATIVEVASNDGYLLQYFKAKKMRVLGIEPSLSVAEVAIKEKGIPTRVDFFGEAFGRQLAREGFAADLIAANNVLAHVPDINDFVAGFRELLKPDGVATFEFPHLLSQIEQSQFDTIYHEHFSYLSLIATTKIMEGAGLRVFDVETLPTHGGSLRLHVCRAESARPRLPSVDEMLAVERAAGLEGDDVYRQFAQKVSAIKYALLELLISLKRRGKSIVAYGAPAKGNTLLNYCGIGSDFLEFTVDKSPQKQGLYLPGSRLEIRGPSAITERRPDYVMILPWNIRDEIMAEMSHISDWGGRFIVPIPAPVIL